MSAGLCLEVNEPKLLQEFESDYGLWYQCACGEKPEREQLKIDGISSIASADIDINLMESIDVNDSNDTVLPRLGTITAIQVPN
jgi:hypothetical protein